MDKLIKVQLTLYKTKMKQELVDIFSVDMMVRPNIGDRITLMQFMSWHELDDSMKKNYNKNGIGKRNYSGFKFEVYETLIMPYSRGTDIACKCVML